MYWRFNSIPNLDWHNNVKPSDSAVRCSLFVLWIAIPCLFGGCSSTQSAIRILVSEPKHFDSQQEADLLKNKSEATAQQIWLRTYGPTGHGSADFDRGFKEGFADYMQFGGTGNPPSLPPRDYWQTQYQSDIGKRAIEHWFAGFRQGAGLARTNGFREQVVVPMSTLNRTYPPTYGYYNELYPPDDVEHRDWHPVTYTQPIDPRPSFQRPENPWQNQTPQPAANPINAQPNLTPILDHGASEPNQGLPPQHDLQPQFNQGIQSAPGPLQESTEPLPSVLENARPNPLDSSEPKSKRNSNEIEGGNPSDQTPKAESLPIIQANSGQYFPGLHPNSNRSHSGPLIPPARPSASVVDKSLVNPQQFNPEQKIYSAANTKPSAPTRYRPGSTESKR